MAFLETEDGDSAAGNALLARISATPGVLPGLVAALAAGDHPNAPLAAAMALRHLTLVPAAAAAVAAAPGALAALRRAARGADDTYGVAYSAQIALDACTGAQQAAMSGAAAVATPSSGAGGSGTASSSALPPPAAAAAAVCAACGVAGGGGGVKLRRCKCGGPRYCGRECQVQAWPGHKQACKDARR